jgi:DNA repair protein RadC
MGTMMGQLSLFDEMNEKPSKKRVNFYRVALVKESSSLYEDVYLTKIDSPRDAAQKSMVILRDMLDDADREKLVVLYLNTKHVITGAEVVSTGSLNSSVVHPREVFKGALLASSAAIIVAHNHPSGDPTPSQEDVNVTERLKKAGEILGIELLDHIVVGENGRFVSLREEGVIR